MDDYLVPVGKSEVRYNTTEDDDTLAADLEKTIGWLTEEIAGYMEVEAKIANNANWFLDKDMSHPKYERYAEVYADQQAFAAHSLLKMHELRELGIGEIAHMSKAGERKHKALVRQFVELGEWVREKRSEAAVRDNAPF